ncbi:MAG: hypothetical protein QOE75_278 [Solirubrobacterales bacterium]|jgi:hypothetical protein|nr:hypothetical protein [Solirubrobacterales bacterium]
MLSRAASLAAAVTASALLLALGATTVAAAPPNWEEQPRSLRLTLLMPASNGYEAVLTTEGHRRVTLSFVKGGSFVAYRTSGRVSRTGIEADFGPIGSVSVRFRGRLLPRFFAGSYLPRGLFPQRKCSGRKPQRLRGSFRGRIELAGERSFATVDAKAVRGEVIRTYRRLCEPAGDGGLFGIAALSLASRAAGEQEDGNLEELLSSIRLNTLTAAGHEGSRQAYVVAMDIEVSGKLRRLERKLKPFALAGSRERHEGLLIERGVFVEGESKAMVASPPRKQPISARLAFPKPLEGEATLLVPKGERRSWTGTLLARLPGIGGVPLAGPGSSAVLCRKALFDFVRSPCDKEAEEMLPRGRIFPVASLFTALF